MSKEIIRTFIAVELTPQVKNSLGGLQQILKRTGADVKWVKPENIHLTLKFLGETRVEDLDKINKVMDKIAKDFNRFEVSLSDLDAFPSENAPRVIWVGLDDRNNLCSKIAERLEEEMQYFGFKKESRRFKPHLTLGRIRSPMNRLKLVEEIKSQQGYFKRGEALQIQISSLSLIKSTLTPGGPIYETLFKTNLNTA